MLKNKSESLSLELSKSELDYETGKQLFNWKCRTVVYL